VNGRNPERRARHVQTFDNRKQTDLVIESLLKTLQEFAETVAAIGYTMHSLAEMLQPRSEESAWLKDRLNEQADLLRRSFQALLYAMPPDYYLTVLGRRLSVKEMLTRIQTTRVQTGKENDWDPF
jgi:hypothetical protein